VQEWIVIHMCLVNFIVPSGLLSFSIPLNLIKALDNCQFGLTIQHDLLHSFIFWHDSL